MNVIQIMKKISDGKNLIFYKKNVFDCYDELQDDYLCIYFNEPIPVKVRFKCVNDNRILLPHSIDHDKKNLHLE